VDHSEIEELLEIRQITKRTISELLNQRGFIETTPSTLTLLTGSCETIGSLFELDYFGRRIHLAQTAQLQLEFLVKVLKRPVWSFDHSFRAESRISNRHLTEFCLVEVEVPNLALNGVLVLQEDILQACIQSLIRIKSSLSRVVVNRLEFLQSIEFPLRIVSHGEALTILRTLNIQSDGNFGQEEEQALLTHLHNAPFFLIHHPPEIKFFNMKRSDDDCYTLSADLIAPPFGEISGGAEREDNRDRLLRNLKNSEMWAQILERGLDESEFDWYLDLWRDGSPGPRGGFGLGFERLIGFLTGIQDIRSCTEFPRNRERIAP
jgi:asparaginyl-tRNA synthetase